jgi:opacity protein-like surface antigen
MKKLMLVVALAALAIPAAAAADNGKRPHPKPSAQAQAVAKNSAWTCKALRAQDKVAFGKAFGKNGNLRNAYGKCVSAHAHAKRLHHVTLTFHNVTVSSTGAVSGGGADGCQFTDAGCTLTSAGTLNGVVGGTYTSTWTILWKQATPNGSGGYCAPATGSTTLSVPVLGTLTKLEKGTVCEVGATGANVEHVLKDGTFTVGSGTGYLTGATGAGTVVFDQKPGASSALGGAVTGSETFSDLTVTL